MSRPKKTYGISGKKSLVTKVSRLLPLERKGKRFTGLKLYFIYYAIPPIITIGSWWCCWLLCCLNCSSCLVYLCLQKFQPRTNFLQDNKVIWSNLMLLCNQARTCQVSKTDIKFWARASIKSSFLISALCIYIENCCCSSGFSPPRRHLTSPLTQFHIFVCRTEGDQSESWAFSGCQHVVYCSF